MSFLNRKLLFSQLCENGQGNTLQFDSSEFTENVNFNYSTFWNDFSHYSFYKMLKADHNEQIEERKNMIDYGDFSDQNQDSFIFADKSKYVSLSDESQSNLIDFQEVPMSDKFITEQFKMLGLSEITQTKTLVPSQSGDNSSGFEFNAHIPQEFNLSIKNLGNISGFNFHDSKLLSKQCNLETLGEFSSIQAKRIRSDTSTIKVRDGSLNIGSYLEASHFHVQSSNGLINLGKKIGIGQKGVIKTGKGQIKIGSVYSNMANLPERSINQIQVSSLSNIKEQLGQFNNDNKGLFIYGGSKLQIGNMQGLLEIDSQNPSQIDINTLETSQFKIIAPSSRAKIFLKSLHSSSYLECQQLELVIEAKEKPDFNIVKYLDNQYQEDQDPFYEDLPTLYINCKEVINLKKMDKFAMLREQLQEKQKQRKIDQQK